MHQRAVLTLRPWSSHKYDYSIHPTASQHPVGCVDHHRYSVHDLVQDVVFKLFSSQMTLWQIFALSGCLAAPVFVGIL